jgi:PST family polysaccharide transporter
MAVLSFNELGVSLAIVRWPADPAKIVPTVNTISIIGSAMFCGAAFFAAPVFTAAMGDAEATDVVRVLILSVFINGVVASPAALLQREFREKTRLGIDQVNVWVGAILSVILAVAGMGAMALAVGRVAGSLISGGMFLAASTLPYRLGVDRSLLGPLLRFGLPLAGTSIIFFAIGYADQLTAGAILGSTALGLYVLAFNLSSWPVSLLAQPLRRVAPAAFSTLQHDKAGMNDVMVSMVAVLTAVALPPIFWLAGSAVPLVGWVYGDAWLPAAAALSWLVIAGMCKVCCDLSYDYLVVQGRSGTVLMIQAGCLLALIPALAAGAAWNGLPGLAAAQTVVSGCVVLPIYAWILSGSGVSLRRILTSIRWPAVAAIATGLLSYGIASGMQNSFWCLPVSGALTLGITALLTYARRGDVQVLRAVGLARSPESKELV